MAVAGLAAGAATPAHGQGADTPRAGTPAPQATRPAPPKRAPKDFFGLVSEDAFATPGEYRRAQFATQASLGVRLLRQTFDWSEIEVAPGSYDFRYYDAFVEDAARADLRILPILFRPPEFRAGRSGSGTSPPRKYSDLGDFGAVLVRRYGPNGTFWSENPTVPKVPIRDWQIWNEPNLKAYWPSGPDPKEYARLLKETAKPMKAADRRAKIVTAGMPQSRIGVPLIRYLTGLYKAGAARSFDTLAINPYDRTAKAVIKNMAAVRKVMRRYRDRAPIWATEVGWSDDGPRGPQRLGPRGQATQLGNLIRLILRSQRSLKVRGLVYYGWRDALPYPGGKDFWGLHTGLLTLEGDPKPAYFALQRGLATAGR